MSSSWSEAETPEDPEWTDVAPGPSDVPEDDPGPDPSRTGERQAQKNREEDPPA